MFKKLEWKKICIHTYSICTALKLSYYDNDSWSKETIYTNRAASYLECKEVCAWWYVGYILLQFKLVNHQLGSVCSLYSTWNHLDPNRYAMIVIAHVIYTDLWVHRVDCLARVCILLERGTICCMGSVCSLYNTWELQPMIVRCTNSIVGEGYIPWHPNCTCMYYRSCNYFFKQFETVSCAFWLQVYLKVVPHVSR